jgi:hypothetical protein
MFENHPIGFLTANLKIIQCRSPFISNVWGKSSLFDGLKKVLYLLLKSKIFKKPVGVKMAFGLGALF